jgi:tetratricopeptide (TPR) repeat protein
MIKRIRLTCLLLTGLMVLPGSVLGHEAGGADPLPTIEPAPMVQALIDDELNNDQTRTDRQIFHGRWDALPEGAELTPDQRARLALLRYELDSPALQDAEADALLRARAALKRGEPRVAIDLLADNGTAQALLLVSRAYEDLGQVALAVKVLRPLREKLHADQIDDPVELTAAAQALSALARLEGRPAQDYQLALNLLGRVRQELDPAYWPALIAEADLLIEKDNAKEGIEALTAALTLNPVCSEAWARLGRLSVRGYAFDRASAVVEKLRAINPSHPLADLIEARSLLQQRDVTNAMAIVDAGLSRFPEHREWMALGASVAALDYDEQATAEAIQHFEITSPGNPLAAYTVGTYLSAARQYEEAEIMLRRAVELAPNWPTPRIELGLLLMQASQDQEAQAELTAATRLDPFNKRAANQLAMLNELLAYERIETEHFVIRYKPGIDEALAKDMPEELETIYRDVTAAFGHRPKRITRIDLMPDEAYFAVRITGLPEVWTIAAATGDAIALTPPREGAGQHGGYDWPNVIRHEFVHTVTLDQTRNRVPHWFTEACAVSQETAPRSYDTCRLLAEALQKDKLFALDQINWGFVRPKSPTDRPLAYAQSDWMLQYIAVRFGHKAITDMLALYYDGVPDTEALERVTGQSAEAFMSGFKAWANGQIVDWGLEQRETSPRLAEVLADSGEPVEDEELSALRNEYPGHPDLLRLIAQRAMNGDDPEAARRAVLRYADSRPVDPWPHRALVALALAQGKSAEALGSLETIDGIEQSSGRWALELAKAYRGSGQYTQALNAVERALHREPYDAGYRELAAALALQVQDADLALHHVYAASLIEPERAQHKTRLAALYHRLGQFDEAHAAAQHALELDPASPAVKFLKPAP